MGTVNHEIRIRQDKPFDKQVKHFEKDARASRGSYIKRLRGIVVPKKKNRIFMPTPHFNPVAEQMLRELDAIHDQNIVYQPIRSKDGEIAGVIAIDRILETLKYLLQRDTIKQHGMMRWNFTGGGREKDETLMMALHREHREETNINIAHNAIEEISTIRLRQRTTDEPRAYAKVYFVMLEEEQLLNMKPGEEQEELGLFAEEEIEQFIKNDMMPVNHINAWRAYQGWRKNLPKKAIKK